MAQINTDPGERDLGHLRLLAVFHFVMATLGALGLLFLIGHYALMNMVMEAAPPTASNGPSPAEVLAMLRWMYWVLGAVGLLFAAGNLLSGLYLRRQVNRGFSLVMAGINCLQMPLGTILGVFTLIVLLRDSVRRRYLDAARPA